MELETAYGVPAVGVHADAFVRLVESVARVNGMPRARRAFVPTPVMGKSSDELLAYISGDDPVNRRPFMDVVVEQLVAKVDEKDLRGVGFDRSASRFVEPDTEDNLRRRFMENRWTDYLPIILPTEERVEAMLAGTSRRPDEVVGTLRPTNYREAWEFTVEKVAVNAVMAGAEPQHLPVILALASTGLTARNSTTSSSAAMVIVNGPIRNELGMNSGIGALGPYNHANAAIGRAYGLLSQNLQGGSVPGETMMGCQGSAMSYAGATFAENEENSPWTPYHVEHGFDPEESVVSTFMIWGNVWTEGLREIWDDKIKAMLAAQDGYLGSTLVMDPIVAREFVERGFDTKEKLADWIHENVRIPARMWWGTYSAKTFYREDAENGVEPYATYWNAPPDELLPVYEKERINIAVAGGSTNAQWSAFTGAPLRRRYARAGDSPIVPIDPWR
jgi:hypothetical protein